MSRRAPRRIPTTSVLGPLLRFDEAACAAGVATLVVAYVAFHRNGLILLEAAFVAAAGAAFAYAERPLRRGEHGRVVTVIAATNWLAFLVPVVITPFVEPVILLAALVPVVVAIPYVSARRLLGLIGCATGSSLLILAVTRGSGRSDVGDDVPGWLTVTVVLVFAPFLAGMIGFISHHNHARLGRALADAQASRARLAAAIDRERRRIERDLHDGAQQRLLALTLDIATARLLLDRDPVAARALLGDIEDDAADAAAELRDLAHGVYPAALADHGLGATLATVAARCHRRCRVDVAAEVGGHRLPTDLESTAYFCCVEALHNAEKHGGPDVSITVAVRLTGDGRRLVFEVADDGVGFDPATRPPGHGLAGLADRVGAAGGTLTIAAGPGRGVTVRGTLPLPPTGRAADHPAGALCTNLRR